MSVNKVINKILGEGAEKFGLDIGIVSRVEGSKYTVKNCESTSIGISSGAEFDLLDTYCADVIRSGKTRFYKDVAEITGMLNIPVTLIRNCGRISVPRYSKTAKSGEH